MIETDRLVAPQAEDPREDAMDRAIRPKSLDEYVGQKAVRDQMSIFLQAARGRGEPLDHTLIFGPPGLGKTTLASIIANEMGVSLKTTSGPVLEKAGDIAALMTNLEPGDVLFIDEIHRLSPFVEEVLGRELRSEFITYKSEEWRQYHQTVSQWEIDQYARLF